MISPDQQEEAREVAAAIETGGVSNAVVGNFGDPQGWTKLTGKEDQCGTG